MEFSYLLDKITNGVVSETPFRHLHIDDFFEKADFRKITASPEIMLQPADNDNALFEKLFSDGYRIVDFPGCTSNHQKYIRWHRTRKTSHETDTSCESFGMVLRLERPRSTIISALQNFLSSPEFVECISQKFEVDPTECKYDAGIQKYLDGYEISPHPDVRSKALTFMVNINPDPDSHKARHHTSYMRLKPEFEYVRQFWEGNPDQDRCWIPWHWCEEVKVQSANNSIVVFAPGDDTMHAIKADYNHLNYQRTQLYGNLWYRKKGRGLQKPMWEDFSIVENVRNQDSSGRQGSKNSGIISGALSAVLPARFVEKLQNRFYRKTEETHSGRSY